MSLRPSRPVLLWGSPLDLPIAAVCTALSRLGTPMFLVDQTRAGETSIEIDIEIDGVLGGWIQVGDQRCALDLVRSVYARPQDAARAVDEALACWLELTPALVVNRLSAMGSNSSKPYQSALIAKAGFAVPDTLVTNDPDALRAFGGATAASSTSPAAVFAASSRAWRRTMPTGWPGSPPARPSSRNTCRAPTTACM